MEVKWTNVICFALAIFAVLMLIHMQESVVSFLRAMGDLGPEQTADEKIWGLIAFSLVAVILVGILKVIMQNKR